MSHVAIPDDVDTVECAVACGTSPPAQRFNLTSREEAPRAQWKNWGTTVEASLRPPRIAGQPTSDRLAARRTFCPMESIRVIRP
jgi:hypothetical protein